MSDYQEEVHELHRILRSGIEELCNHAKENSFFNYPYGRKPDPTPLISEEDFVGLGGPDTDDIEPPFVYNYGFDPLKFLSDYIKWAHPRTVEARRQAKVDAQARLAFRARHAMNQLLTQQALVERIGHLRAGIYWGPFVHLTSDATKFVVTLQPLKISVVYLQLAFDQDFTQIVHTIRMYMPFASASPLVSIEVGNLTMGTQYFLRTFAISYEELGAEDNFPSPATVQLSDFDEEYVNVSDRWSNSYVSSAFTFPSDGEENFADYLYNDISSLENRLSLQFVGQFPGSLQTSNHVDARHLPNTNHTFPAPSYTYILGDVLSHVDYTENTLAHYNKHLSGLFYYLLHRFDLRDSALTVAWRDSHTQSSHALRLEEVAHKQYKHELKKYNKKYGLDDKGKVKKTAKDKDKGQAHIPPPPVLKRPHLTEQLQAVLAAFPSTVYTDASPAETTSTIKKSEEETLACRMLYSCKYITPEIQVFVLDLRRGLQKHDSSDYLGREQAEWLAHNLKHSSATWKLIVSGKSFGLNAFEDIYLAKKSSDERVGTPSFTAAEVASIIADAEKTSEEGSVKQVVIADDHSGPAAHRTGNLYDDCDEVYGRSKYSLQYILASYQKKHSEISMLPPISELAPIETLYVESEESVHYNIHVTSGIVLLTGGVSSFLSRTFQAVAVEPSVAVSSPSNNTANNSGGSRPNSRSGTPKENKEREKDLSRPNSTAGTAATTAVAGVPELSEASQIQEYNLLYCNSKDVNAPAYVSIYKDLNSTALAPSTIVPPSRPDCLVGLLTEISLGHGGQDLTGESSLLTGQYDVTQVTSSSVDWKVASGMDCQTVMWPATREESVVTRCELQVLGNGSLFLEMFAEKTDVCERKRLVSVALCLAVSTNPTSSEEGLSKSESVHMT